MKITVTVEIPPEEVIAIQKNLLENNSEQINKGVSSMFEQFQQLWMTSIRQMTEKTK
jgi:hypothetical protein